MFKQILFGCAVSGKGKCRMCFSSGDLCLSVLSYFELHEITFPRARADFHKARRQELCPESTQDSAVRNKISKFCLNRRVGVAHTSSDCSRFVSPLSCLSTPSRSHELTPASYLFAGERKLWKSS